MNQQRRDVLSAFGWEKCNRNFELAEKVELASETRLKARYFHFSRSKSNLLAKIMQQMEGHTRALETGLLEAILFEEKNSVTIKFGG